MNMTSKERVSRMYAHKEADRIPIIDSSWKEHFIVGIRKECKARMLK